MKTIIYGGAFDPPHMAHEHLVRMIAEKYNPERLFIVPSGLRSDKSYKISLEHRIKILSIFTEDLSDIGVELCDDFMVGRIINGTTLGVDRVFRERFGHSPTQVFGTDVIPDMKLWDPSGRVEKEIPKIFVRRIGSPKVDFSNISNHLIITPELPSDIATLSSSQVRENIKNRIFHGLAPRIREYIADNKLYHSS
ncbi:MAG: hypothetical protein WC774_01160 [Candidatus Gracilibacteria bacterium]|jgi:nicotinate-nucleotide adenylyltransferase